jgi:type II secretion system protein N
MRLPSLEGWRRRAAYAAFFAAVFLLALHFTFPSDAVKERIILEAAARGWLVRMSDIGPAGLGGVRARGVTLESRDGARIPIEEFRATLRPWALLLGRRSMSFDVRLFDGRATGVVEEGRGLERLQLKGADIDLGRAAAVRKATGLDLAGVLRADVDVTLDVKEPNRSTGRLDLTVERAALKGGEVQVPGMGGNLTLPRVSLGTVVAKAQVRNGRAEFETLEAKGEDLQASAEQLYFVLQSRLDYAPLFGKARVRVADAFWQKSGTAGLRGVVEAALSSARGRDGTFGFQIYGTLGRPQARPAAP